VTPHKYIVSVVKPIQRIEGTHQRLVDLL